MFFYYLKRIVKSPAFGGGILLLTLLLVMGCYEDLTGARANHLSVLYCFIITNTVGISHVLLPVLVPVPFLFIYAEELNEKLLYYQYIRSNTAAVYRGRLLAAIVSPALVCLISVVLFTGICIAYGAGWEAEDSMIQFFRNAAFANTVQERLWLVYGVYGLAFLLYSLPWTLIGLVASLFCKNKYIIFAASFIIFISFSYITQLLGLYWLDPGMTLLKGMVRSMAGGGIYYAFTYHMSFIAVLSLIYYIVSKRKFYYEGI